MEILSTEVLSNLGIGVVAIIAIIYIVNTHAKERNQERVSRQEQHKVFMEFVSSNNHKVTDLVRESTAAIVASSKNIEESTNMIKRVCELLDRRVNDK